MPGPNGGQKQDYRKAITPVFMARAVSARKCSGGAQTNELGGNAPVPGTEFETVARGFCESRKAAVAGGEHLS